MPEAAKGIAILHEDRESTSFRINCECTDTAHAVDAYIETSVDNDGVLMTFFVDSATESPVSLWHRLVIAYNVLTKGRYSSSHELLLDEQATLNFLQSTGKAVDKVKSK